MANNQKFLQSAKDLLKELQNIFLGKENVLKTIKCHDLKNIRMYDTKACLKIK